MINRFLLISSFAVAALPSMGMAKARQPVESPVATSTMTSISSTQILADIHHANQMEIQMGKLAQDRSASDAVRQYGQRLQTDHANADKRTTDVAKTLGITLPSGDQEMARADQDMMEKLNSLQGKDFDQAFLTQMSDDHRKNIDMLQMAQRQTPGPAVSQLITEVLPVLQEHKKIADNLTAKLGTTRKPI